MDNHKRNHHSISIPTVDGASTFHDEVYTPLPRRNLFTPVTSSFSPPRNKSEEICDITLVSGYLPNGHDEGETIVESNIAAQYEKTK